MHGPAEKNKDATAIPYMQARGTVDGAGIDTWEGLVWVVPTVKGICARARLAKQDTQMSLLKHYSTIGTERDDRPCAARLLSLVM